MNLICTFCGEITSKSTSKGSTDIIYSTASTENGVVVDIIIHRYLINYFFHHFSLLGKCVSTLFSAKLQHNHLL